MTGQYSVVLDCLLTSARDQKVGLTPSESVQLHWDSAGECVAVSQHGRFRVPPLCGSAYRSTTHTVVLPAVLRRAGPPDSPQGEMTSGRRMRASK